MLMANQLDLRPKKAKRPNETFRLTTLKRGQISEFWPKVANLAMLLDDCGYEQPFPQQT